MPKLEAILVCRYYSDYLFITLPKNKDHFDNVVVVTSFDDYLTHNVCNINNVKYVIYNDFNKNGAKFNFGGARQFGINNLIYKDWVIFMDADIIMPKNFKEIFNIENKDIEKFYGSYRRFILTYLDYKKLINGEKNKLEFEAIEGSGCGFWQCLNLNNKMCKRYGLNNLYCDSYSAEQIDIDFLKKFCPLVENDTNLVRTNIDLWHLGNHGINNYGRVDDKFFI